MAFTVKNETTINYTDGYVVFKDGTHKKCKIENPHDDNHITFYCEDGNKYTFEYVMRNVGLSYHVRDWHFCKYRPYPFEDYIVVDDDIDYLIDGGYFCSEGLDL